MGEFCKDGVKYIISVIVLGIYFFCRNPIPETNEQLDNIKWEPYNSKTQKYLNIGNKLVVQEKLYEKRYSEWERLFPLTQYTKKGKYSG